MVTKILEKEGLRVKSILVSFLFILTAKENCFRYQLPFAIVVNNFNLSLTISSNR